MINNQTRNNEYDARSVLRECAELLEEKKGENVVILDLREVNSYLDFFLIVSGNSHVHCRALARGLMKHLSERKIHPRNKPDLESGWIILDYSDIIIHIFSEDLRGFYQLEKLWSDALRIEA